MTDDPLHSENRVGQLPSVVVVSLGCSMMIFGAGLGLDAGWNAGAMFGSGLLIAALGLIGQELAQRKSADKNGEQA